MKLGFAPSPFNKISKEPMPRKMDSKLMVAYLSQCCKVNSNQGQVFQNLDEEKHVCTLQGCRTCFKAIKSMSCRKKRVRDLCANYVPGQLSHL